MLPFQPNFCINAVVFNIIFWVPWRTKNALDLYIKRSTVFSQGNRIFQRRSHEQKTTLPPALIRHKRVMHYPSSIIINATHEEEGNLSGLSRIFLASFLPSVPLLSLFLGENVCYFSLCFRDQQDVHQWSVLFGLSISFGQG